jgi:hypothetical protein
MKCHSHAGYEKNPLQNNVMDISEEENRVYFQFYHFMPVSHPLLKNRTIPIFIQKEKYEGLYCVHYMHRWASLPQTVTVTSFPLLTK